MERYNKVLGSKIVRIGLPVLAVGLVVTEGILWREKLASNASSNADSPTQLQDTATNNEAETGSTAKIESADGSLELANLSKQNKLAQVSDVPKGTFNYGGSTTWAPIRKDVDPEIQALQPTFRLQYTSPAADSGRAAGSGTGIRMLLDDELLFSQSSRSITEEEKAEAQRNGYSLKQVAIAIDGIAVAVNPDLEIPGLTIAQLRDIYTGKITNWSEVGGPNLEIVPHARRAKDSGTVEFFVESVLEDAQISPNVRFVEGTTVGIRRVSQTPGGIYYASAPELVGQCGVRSLPIGNTAEQLIPPYQPPYVQSSECPRYRNQLNAEQFQNGEYPITRELFVIVKQNGQLEEQAGVAYANFLLTEEGQALIERAGFVGIGNN